MIPLALAPRVTVSRLGATFPEDLEGKAWKAIWADLRNVEGSLNWIIGDWLNFGKRKFGEKYALALDITEWQRQRLYDAAYVCSQVPISLRNEKLDWSHHRVVAPLGEEEQGKLLQEAQEKDWTVSELRVYIRRSQAVKKRSNAKVLGFLPTAWIAQGLRWFRQQDFDSWTKESKAALCLLLKPLVEIYNRLQG